eukprot:3219589-Pleurochrysis_carterae.AAC.7
MLHPVIKSPDLACICRLCVFVFRLPLSQPSLPHSAVRGSAERSIRELIAIAKAWARTLPNSAANKDKAARSKHGQCHVGRPAFVVDRWRRMRPRADGLALNFAICLALWWLTGRMSLAANRATIWQPCSLALSSLRRRLFSFQSLEVAALYNHTTSLALLSLLAAHAQGCLAAF